ncbi:GspH/FimT family pseudopilin [Brevundimonas sp.]|uniref:GspH/FimT family pseudopilin n=1 Tax=Brevundimonas sp. TaxID=1871086 RepID=UPI002D437E7A|nr:GspH/FimT family pseudopilin [Brevundimonas sp.]HYC98942.1 GspH/FimT family pseudopilin [Brevundimonas sp.]
MSADDRAQAAPRRAWRDSARKSRAGFTLVELLMTVAIVGLAAGAVVLSVPDPRPSVADDAERFAARLSRAREEAVLSNRPVAVEATAAGYGFSSFDGAGWTALEEGPFGQERWSDGVSVSPTGPVRVVFDPTGVAEPAALTLSRDGRASRVEIDGAGEVTIND